MSSDCAGILFRARGPFYLLCKRSDTGEWCQPGGHLEDGESPEQAAVRECVEEIGGCPEGMRWPARKTPLTKGGGTFTCFVQDIEKPFRPELNDEHTKWGWFAPDKLPSNIHPDVARTIVRVTGNELHIAKRMSEGELLSPQRYHNYWLFDVRISGTGLAYRSKHDEYVLRPADYYQSEEFLQRCNGLPLIFEHPKERVTLDTKEFRQRSIGSMFLPYIKAEEPWGIAKVFDDDAARLMCTTHASTSPAVVFRDAGSTETVKTEDGSTVLIEGEPSSLDHLAVCREGVWDKGGEPTGVNIEGDPAVDDMNEQAPAWADAIVKRCDEIGARLDAIEGKGKEEPKAEEVKEEVKAFDAEEHKDARKDGEEVAKEEGKSEEKEEQKAAEAVKTAEKDGEKERDAERADAQGARIKGLEAQIAAMQARLTDVTKPRTNADRDELSRVQRRAESVAMAFSDSNAISPPLYDESPIAYRKRCAAAFQKHSPKAKSVELKNLDAQTFAVMEELIYADAQTAATAPATQPKGRLIPHVDRSTGHTITTYTGDPEACWGPFKHRGFSGRINKDVGKRIN